MYTVWWHHICVVGTLSCLSPMTPYQKACLSSVTHLHAKDNISGDKLVPNWGTFTLISKFICKFYCHHLLLNWLYPVIRTQLNVYIVYLLQYLWDLDHKLMCTLPITGIDIGQDPLHLLEAILCPHYNDGIIHYAVRDSILYDLNRIEKFKSC